MSTQTMTKVRSRAQRDEESVMSVYREKELNPSRHARDLVLTEDDARAIISGKSVFYGAGNGYDY